jgi:hypothetical protein
MKDISVLKFTYQKSLTDSKDRTLFVLNKPSDCYFGVELSNDPISMIKLAPFFSYVQERDAIDAELRAKYGIDDLEIPYKQFKVDKIVNLTEEKITL